MFLARLGIALSITVPHILIADLLVAIGSAIVGTTGSSLLSETGSPGQSGFLMGLSESAQSLAGVVTPAVGGYLYEHYGSSAPGYGSAFCCVLAIAVFKATERVSVKLI